MRPNNDSLHTDVPYNEFSFDNDDDDDGDGDNDDDADDRGSGGGDQHINIIILRK